MLLVTECAGYKPLYSSDKSNFSIGKIDRDQIKSYAKRKGIELKTMEKWLSPNLGYIQNNT